MLPRVVLVLLAFTLVAVPLGGAAKPPCASHASSDETAALTPLKGGIYFYAGSSGEKGFWSESNGVDSLQVKPCRDTGNGLYYFHEDHYLGLTIPPDALL
jgi:hypothetical protein